MKTSNINKVTLIRTKRLTKIKQPLLSLILKFFLIGVVSACTYEPKTMVKKPRASLSKVPLKITPSIESKLNIHFANKMVRIEKKIQPIVGINFSTFKRNLIGLNKNEIIELLDKPTFERTEHPASIWQYQSSICFIDIFFYSNKNNLVVDHVEVRSKNIERTDEKRCFSSLLDSEYDEKK